MWLGGRRGGDCTTRRSDGGGGTCYSYEDLVRAWVDILAGGIGGEVVAAGAGVGYYGILWGNEGVWGGATGRGRRNIFSI